MTTTYYAPKGGHPAQTELLTDRAMFTTAYAVIPRGCLQDIVTSKLPFWDNTRLWVLARPLSGFAETFSQYIVEVAPGGGSDRPETSPQAEGVLFVVEGQMRLTIGDDEHTLDVGGYAFLPPGTAWTVRNDGSAPLRFHWIRWSVGRTERLRIHNGPLPHHMGQSEEPLSRSGSPRASSKAMTNSGSHHVKVIRDLGFHRFRVAKIIRVFHL